MYTNLKNSVLVTALEELVGTIESDACSILASGKVVGEGIDYHKSYGFVPFNVTSFIETMVAVVRHIRKQGCNPWDFTFLDAGCGIGTKLILAESMGFPAIGLEIDQKMIRRAKRQYGIRSLKVSKGRIFRSARTPVIVNQDVLKHHYDHYGVIFFYCPFRNDELESEFEQRVYEQMLPGSYVIPRMHQSELPQSIKPIDNRSRVYWKPKRRRS